jgi:hypothetical protein
MLEAVADNVADHVGVAVKVVEPEAVVVNDVLLDAVIVKVADTVTVELYVGVEDKVMLILPEDITDASLDSVGEVVGDAVLLHVIDWDCDSEQDVERDSVEEGEVVTDIVVLAEEDILSDSEAVDEVDSDGEARIESDTEVVTESENEPEIDTDCVVVIDVVADSEVD